MIKVSPTRRSPERAARDVNTEPTSHEELQWYIVRLMNDGYHGKMEPCRMWRDQRQ